MKEADLRLAKDCPFCGGHELVVGVAFRRECPKYCISCDDCGTTGPVFQSEELALVGWNELCGGKNEAMPQL